MSAGRGEPRRRRRARHRDRPQPEPYSRRSTLCSSASSAAPGCGSSAAACSSPCCRSCSAGARTWCRAARWSPASTSATSSSPPPRPTRRRCSAASRCSPTPIFREHPKAHRVIGVNDDGTLSTKGDANITADTSPRADRDVRGLARLLVEFVGLPADLDAVGAVVLRCCCSCGIAPAGRPFVAPRPRGRPRGRRGGDDGPLRRRRRALPEPPSGGAQHPVAASRPRSSDTACAARGCHRARLVASPRWVTRRRTSRCSPARCCCPRPALPSPRRTRNTNELWAVAQLDYTTDVTGPQPVAVLEARRDGRPPPPTPAATAAPAPTRRSNAHDFTKRRRRRAHHRHPEPRHHAQRRRRLHEHHEHDDDERAGPDHRDRVVQDDLDHRRQAARLRDAAHRRRGAG